MHERLVLDENFITAVHLEFSCKQLSRVSLPLNPVCHKSTDTFDMLHSISILIYIVTLCVMADDRQLTAAKCTLL